MIRKQLCMYLFVVYKGTQRVLNKVQNIILGGVFKGEMYYHHVCYNPDDVNIVGLPLINIGKQCKVEIGNCVSIVSGVRNGIDASVCSKINVKDYATLRIGSNSGMTNVVIQCHESVTIGNYVNIGAGSMIFDTDFHSLYWKDRYDGTDVSKRATKPVTIKDFVFIGAHSVILKGVTIGEKSIVGAGSVVSKDIPDGEIWAGNPARFIRKIYE